MHPPAPAPLLTRIVTVYRQWEFVARWADDSRLADPRVAWIFVNDAASPDDLLPPSLRGTAVGRGARFVEDGVNRGRSAARNRGAALAATPWIAHIDGDDTPLPLPEVAPFLEGGDDLVFFPFATHDDRFVPGSGGEAWTEERVDTAVFGELFRALGLAEPVDWRPASLLWRRDFFEQIGGYDGRCEGAEDAQLVWKALGRGARTARGGGALVSIWKGAAAGRPEQIHLTAGRLRFWEEVARSGGTAGEIGRRAEAVQRRVAFWTLRDALVREEGPRAGWREGAKMIWNAVTRRGPGR